MVSPPAPALTINALGRKCPIPIIMLAEQIRDVPLGAVVAVLADDPAAYTEMTDLVMTYLGGPGVERPQADALFTNQFTGKIKPDSTQWAQVRARVSEYDKVFG